MSFPLSGPNGVPTKPTAAGSIPHLGAAAPSLLDRLKQRFDEGGQAFGNVLREEERRRLAQQSPRQSSIRFLDVRIVALLFIPGTEEVIQVLSGTNLFRVTETGSVERIPARDFFPSDPTHFQIRCLENELETAISTKKVERHATNDFLLLGNKRFLVKILPKECQANTVWKEGAL